MSFQLLELPENEQVISRQITLPSSGGTIGRSYECTIQLPDFSRTLSRVHVEICPNATGGFDLIDRSVNGCEINGVTLAVGQSVSLHDGDNVRMGGYLMLASNMSAFAEPGTSTLQEQSRPHKEQVRVQDEKLGQEPRDPLFDLGDVLNDPTEAILTLETLPDDDTNCIPSFSAENVAIEDGYDYDPFEDDESLSLVETSLTNDDIVMGPQALSKEAPYQGGAVTSATPAHHHSENGVTVSDNSAQQVLDTHIERLTQLVEHQQTALIASIDRERLFSCLETTLDRFLAEFSPHSLEEEFNDYVSSWGNKEKKYWALYKKQFLRKQKRSEFKRQFTALLLEELRDK
ncbi:FHA domain-containing protein [Vibrio agarilyticus]|nr:FHA domain-containing protein [Vibrio agarilyticus]